MKSKIGIARILILILLVINLQVAFAYFLHPADYTFSFELTGTPGIAVVQGYGVLFIMWNIPAILAILHPQRHRSALIAAILMQVVGLVGELFILVSIPEGYPIARATIHRFVFFDSTGVVLLLFAFFLSRNPAED
ncbi:MAG: hypothetical protein JXA19_07320 [Anaerolineales bacterium]|nr:hypothetical protein [Anaerolineales bacterium]